MRYSALYYYRARHYDPKVGRFLQTDPVEPRPEEMNSYVYVSNNPVNHKDPQGLAAEGGSSDECSCTSNCVKDMVGTKWGELKSCAAKAGIGSLSFSIVACTMIGMSEPYLLPLMPACAGLTTASTTFLTVSTCLLNAEVGSLAGAAGCAAGCYGY